MTTSLTLLETKEPVTTSLRALAAKIARSPTALLSAAVAVVFTVAFSVWLPNLGLIWDVAITSGLPIGERVSFVLSSLEALVTAYSFGGSLLIILLGVLVGLNVAASVVLLRSRAATPDARLGSMGVVVGLLGVGCSACGIGLLGALIGAGTAASVAVILPLGGLEFGLAGAVILIGAFTFTARRAARPNACPIEPSDSGSQLHEREPAVAGSAPLSIERRP